MFSLVMFDLDGTPVDTAPQLAAVSAALADHCGRLTGASRPDRVIPTIRAVVDAVAQTVSAWEEGPIALIDNTGRKARRLYGDISFIRKRE